MERKKKIIIGAAMAALVLLIIGVNIYKNSGEKGIPVEAFQVKKKNLEQVVLASGKVEVQDKQEYTAQVAATVTKIYVSTGDRVKAGQLLMQLDTAQLERQLKQDQANLRVQEANLAKARSGARSQVIEQDRANLKKAETAFQNARAAFERTNQLFQAGAVSQESLENAKLNYVTAEAEYRSAQKRLEMDLAGESGPELAALEAQVQQAKVAVELTEDLIAKASVRAGMNGIVLSVDLEEGSYAAIGAPLISIGNPQRLIVKSEVSESDSGNLRVGQPVTITAAAAEGAVYKGKVAMVSPVAVTKLKDQAEQTNVEITVEITEFDSKLKPGYSVDLNITTASLKGVPVIPYEAIIEKGHNRFVFVINDNHRVSLRKVETGVGNQLYLHVKKGLRPGDSIVVNPPENLKDKDVVDVRENTASAAKEKTND